jgi:hypothetical protein
MVRRSPFTYALALFAAFLPASCLDLREVDPCHSLALSYCEKRCGISHDICVSNYRDTCAQGEWTLSQIESCAERLEPLEHCAGYQAVEAACPELPGLDAVGSSCLESCTNGLSCTAFGCSKRCQSDAECNDTIWTGPRPVLCSADGWCRASCKSDRECEEDGQCVDGPDGWGVCSGRVGGVPKEPKLGDSCSVVSQCPANSVACWAGDCTKLCAANADCAELNRRGFPSECVSVKGVGICKSACLSSSDCVPLDRCRLATTVEGTPATICMYVTELSMPCRADEECPADLKRGQPVHCVPRKGVGNLCLASCSDPLVPCPEGTACTRISGQDVCSP